MVDNMGYWQKMLKLGYVTANPVVNIPPAIFTGSRIKVKGIQIQDSPDVCVSSLNGTTQSENSIFINPENDQEILNSNNSSDWDGQTVNNLFGTDDRSTEDAGITWAGEIEGTGESNNGDPCVVIGLNNRWYEGRISSGFGQSVAWSDDEGITWNDVTVANVPYPGSDLLDKNHLCIDNSPASPFQGRLYDGWTCFVNSSADLHQIQVSSSADNGLTWSTPLEISSGVSAISYCQGVNLQTGTNGELYGAFIVYDYWPSDECAIGFAKSLNGGTVFNPATRIINNIRGIRTTGTNKNMRVNSFPSMTVDNSNSPRKGNIYIVWANIGVPGVDTGSSIDVYMLRSTDQGSTWSVPIKVNQDNTGHGKQHFFPWISCDPFTGNLCVVYYDDRNVLSSQCETWISYSYNGGDTWTDMKVSDVAFTPVPIPGLAANYFGDYIGVTTRNMMAYPIWTDNRRHNALTYVSPVNLGPAPNQPYVVYNSYVLASIQKDTGQNMNYDDSLHLSVSLKNVGDQPANNVTAYVSASSPYVTITDSTAVYGDFTPGEVKSVTNGFSFKVSDTIADGLRVKFNVRAVTADTFWLSDFAIEAHAPALHINTIIINDSTGNNNGHFDPGENDEVLVNLSNTGAFPCINTWAKLSSPSDDLTFSIDSVFLDTLLSNQSKTAIFSVVVAPDACLHSPANLNVHAGSGLYRKSKSQFETIGLIMEDWETGDFSKFPWTFGGNANWVIDTIRYAGRYSARSGVVGNNETSRMQLVYTSGINDSISFYCKVSSEPNCDYLHFFIDDVPLGQWSGEQSWARAVYPVSAGTHTFKWWYVTDISYLDGSNAGWVDNIILPSPPMPYVFAGNDTAICSGNTMQLHGTVSFYDSLIWTTSGDGTFSNDTILNPVYTAGSNDISSGSARLRLKAYGVNGCFTSSMHLAVSSYPVSHLTQSKDTVCGGKVITLHADTIPGDHYLWTPGGFTTPGIIVDTSLTGGFGSYWIRLRVSNAVNCVSYDSARVTFKDCTGIQESEGSSRYEIFPNPNDGSFTIKLNNAAAGHLTLRIQNAINVLVFEDRNIEINPGFMKTYKLNLPAGIYLVTFEDNLGNHNMKMVVR